MDVFRPRERKKHPMKKGYHHLTQEERAQIYALKKQGVTQKQIAESIGKSPSCICKELKRNKGARGYRYGQAHEKARQRRHIASTSLSIRMSGNTKALVLQYLKEDWSPVQISGYLKKQAIFIRHETIYKWIWADKKNGGDLHTHLRHRGKKYNKRSSKNAGRGLIPNRIDIKERPPIVDTKSRLGDFEVDTIIGKNRKGAIVSIVDKKTKFTKRILIKDKSAELVTQALIFALNINVLQTITADNGKEFAKHADVAKALNLDFYFATPYHSWERGLNEHTNGLVRQYFPKKTDFAMISQEDVSIVEKKLNQRPRKELKFDTPENAFLCAIHNPQEISLHS